MERVCWIVVAACVGAAGAFVSVGVLASGSVRTLASENVIAPLDVVAPVGTIPAASPSRPPEEQASATEQARATERAGATAQAGAAAQAAAAPAPLRIIAFGAHPDDAELRASGVAALWAAQGHKVKFVAMTNGDIGHFSQAGGPLATRRKAEVTECARILGIQTDVLDIHDGELMPSLENRKIVARLIREWQADIVLGHRPYDYHADHRYTGVLMEDAAVLVAAPFFTPDTPAVKRNPVFMYYSDNFKQPYPFDPTLVVSIDAVAEKKWACIAAMPSQFGDKDSWQGRTLPNVPQDDAARQAYLIDQVKQRSANVANQYRDRLIARYGEAKGRQVKYAEAFQLCQYGRQLTVEQLKEMFPFK